MRSGAHHKGEQLRGAHDATPLLRALLPHFDHAAPSRRQVARHGRPFQLSLDDVTLQCLGDGLAPAVPREVLKVRARGAARCVPRRAPRRSRASCRWSS